MKIVKQEISIESDLNGIDILKKLERFARKCTRTEHLITDSSYIKFMENIIRREHFGVLEHHLITVHGTASRAIQAELFRHRHISILAESTRYVNYVKNNNVELSFIMPYSDQDNSNDMQTFRQVEYNYNRKLENGFKPEIARDILPLAFATDFSVSGSIRSWREILEKRNEKHAHPHMIELASMIEEQLKELVPIVFEGIHKTKQSEYTEEEIRIISDFRKRNKYD